MSRGIASKNGYTGLILQCCATAQPLRIVKNLHAQTIVSGILFPSAPYLFGEPHDASDDSSALHSSQLPEEFGALSRFAWNSLMKQYAHSNSKVQTLLLFARMQIDGHHRPDNFTYVSSIKACSDLRWLDLGVSVHAMSLLSGYHLDIWIQNTLLAMYMNCGQEGSAKNVFDKIKDRGDVVSWNAMILGHSRNGSAEDSLCVFDSMKDAGVEPDAVTLTSVLPACGYLKKLEIGRSIHAYADEKGLTRNTSACNALIDLYGKCGAMDEAESVFLKTNTKDVVTWTTLMNGHILNGRAARAIELCSSMHLHGVRVNSVTIASLLSASASVHDLRVGQCLHGWALRNDMASSAIVETALINMYARCDRFRFSFRVFVKKNQTEPWNAAISACSYSGRGRKAMGLFKKMMEEGVEPDIATLNSLLPASASLAEISQAENIHSHILKSGFSTSIEVATSLMDTYSKSGNLESLHKIFNGVPSKDVHIWTVMIVGYGNHGKGKIAFSLFLSMVLSGVRPNAVSFANLLHACNHGGLVDEGMSIFRFMMRHQAELLNSGHVSSMVDMLGRAGRLDEAYGLIRAVPSEANHAAWGALLGGCVVHGNVELGEVSAEWLFANESENTGSYILLGKLYAAAGRWDEAEQVRAAMDRIGLKKSTAHSGVS